MRFKDFCVALYADQLQAVNDMLRDEMRRQLTQCKAAAEVVELNGKALERYAALFSAIQAHPEHQEAARNNEAHRQRLMRGDTKLGGA